MSSTTPDAAVSASTEPPRPARSGVPFWAQVFIGLAVGVVLALA